jgi:hypothetical protein
MRARTFAALVAVLLLAWPVAAQDQRGTIEGTVKDTSGAVLPGVTIEAKTANGAVLSTTSDASGVFRFPSVAPGLYEVSATLASFSPQKFADVQIGLGQLKRLEFALSLAGVQETVSVTAESPLVDIKQSARQTNIRAEQVELLPKGRDFSSLVAQAPGANQEDKLGGLSIDGASAGENRFIVDGIETTDVQDGTQGKRVITEFLEEVQVKSSGYTAEYGGATGGVINVLTKSGTNNWRGSALFNWEGDALRGDNRPTLRINLTNALAAEYITYPKDKANRIEPGFSLGGPITTNRAWFFGAYQPALTTNERTVNAATAQNPSLTGSFDEDQKLTTHFITGNVTSQFSDSLRGRLAYNNSWSKTEGLLPAQTGTDPVGTNYGYTQTFPNWSVSGNLDWTASQKLFFGVRGGYYRSDINDSNTTDQIRYLFSTGSNTCGSTPATCPFPEVPANLQRLNGFSSVPNNSKVTRDEQTRAYFQGDGTLYATAGGQHQIKFGAQVDRVGNDVLNALEDRNLVRLRWNTNIGGVRGRYGYYQVRSNAVEPKKGFVTAGAIHTTNIGLFIQDTWTINRLTINGGIRTERERVPTYQTGTDIPEFGVAFNFGDKFAPRVGFAYDIKGDGRTKAFGSWGIFYDIFKLELPRGSFGGDRWLEYYYTLDTFDWTTLADGPNCPPACVGTLIDPVASGLGTNPIDFRHVSLDSDHIDPDLKPMKQQEATFGVEHQLNDVLAVSVRYVHKQIDRAIEDIQTARLDASGTEVYIIGNPGEGLATQAFTDPDVSIPKPVRDYDSVELAVEKRLANNWYLRGSYLWSRLYGNYSGLSQSDENGRTSPNVGRLWDYPLMMFQDGGVPALGRLATDRPHQLKAAFIYQFNFGTSVGVDQFVGSGLPISREIGTFGTNNLPVNYLGRLSDGRTPTFSQTNLLVQHGFRIGGGRQLQVSLNVLNLFSQDASVARFSTEHRVNGVTPDQTLFYTGQQTLESLITGAAAADNGFRDPRFLMDNTFQVPLQARFGVKFLF